MKLLNCGKSTSLPRGNFLLPPFLSLVKSLWQNKVNSKCQFIIAGMITQLCSAHFTARVSISLGAQLHFLSWSSSAACSCGEGPVACWSLLRMISQARAGHRFPEYATRALWLLAGLLFCSFLCLPAYFQVFFSAMLRTVLFMSVCVVEEEPLHLNEPVRSP